MILAKSPRERNRFFRFAIVGTIGAAVDFTVFNFSILVLNIPSIWANVLSFSVAVVSNFIWNRYWTFPDSRSKRMQRQLFEFFIVNLIGVMIRTPIFILLERVFLQIFEMVTFLPASTQNFLSHNMALGGAMIIVLFWNFFVNRRWTYSDVR